MERENVLNYPPEALDLLREYQQGRISRRSFLDRAGKFTLGSLAAASMLETLAPHDAWAQQVPNPSASLQPDRFDYSPITDRPVLRWPNNARVAVWVAPNMEWYEYTPLRSPTTPDIPRYSYRDYGNRVGFWRMLEVTDKHNIRCCACLNGAVLDHCPEIRDAIQEERAYWEDMIATVRRHTGKQLKGRLGAGGGNTVNTPDLMAEFGLYYHTDWLMDDQPFPLKVKNGAKFIHVPYTYQLNDAIVPGQGRDAAYFSQMIKDQFDVLYEEGAESGKVMCISLHPYWIGKPHRAKYLDEALQYIRSHDAVWHTTADDIADYYLANYYDQVVAYVEQQKQKGLV